MTKKRTITEVLGWYGVVALLAAYGLASFGVITASDAWFQVLNITGAVGIVADALGQKNWQPAVLNIVWAVIGAIALAKIVF